MTYIEKDGKQVTYIEYYQLGTGFLLKNTQGTLVLTAHVKVERDIHTKYNAKIDVYAHSSSNFWECTRNSVRDTIMNCIISAIAPACWSESSDHNEIIFHQITSLVRLKLNWFQSPPLLYVNVCLPRLESESKSESESESESELGLRGRMWFYLELRYYRCLLIRNHDRTIQKSKTVEITCERFNVPMRNPWERRFSPQNNVKELWEAVISWKMTEHLWLQRMHSLLLQRCQAGGETGISKHTNSPTLDCDLCLSTAHPTSYMLGVGQTQLYTHVTLCRNKTKKQNKTKTKT